MTREQPTLDSDSASALDSARIQKFVRDGFVKIEAAFPPNLAAECRTILWRDSGCLENDPKTWTQPVIRLGIYAQEPFVQAANTPVLHQAFDQLAAPGRWLPRTSLGTFPIRFPSRKDPGDAGWHIDSSFPPETGDSGDYFDWRINISSKGRALLMLFLFSDVGERDAPTRIRVGSHFDVAKMLAPFGERGRSLREMAASGFFERPSGPEVLATGSAGTVYLCHPFLVHAAQPHHGTRPRFLAQPALQPAQPFLLDRTDGAYSPVEQAIRIALGKD
jgi:hypothetical protein